MSTHHIVLEIKKLLRNLDAILEKAVANAASRKFDPAVLLQSRLAPDMFPLVSQVRLACDHAKWAAARSAGKESPSHADNEQSVEELRVRIAGVVSFIDGFSAADFAGADDRRVSMPRWEGKSMSGSEYLIEYALPNFAFHYTTAYAILRHNGVDLGKRDYLGTLPMK